MGLDGGTIPTRGELVRVKQKPEQKDKSSDTNHEWNNCTITQLPLDTHIVLCHLGMLFNKRSILELLLGKNNLRECGSFQHIESLRDVRKLWLTPNRMQSASASPYVCPVTGLEMNGKHRFICLWECGCVLSERAMKEVASTTCHNCDAKYTKSDIVIINPNDEDFEIMRTRMAQRKSTRKSTQPTEVRRMTSHNRSLESNNESSASTSTSTINNVKTSDRSAPTNTTSDRSVFTDKTSDRSVLTDETSDRSVLTDSYTGESTSTCLVTSKRRYQEVEKNSTERHSKTKMHSKSKKSKKDHKHKKHKKGKKGTKHEKTQSYDAGKPILHPGWSEILSKGSQCRW